MKRTTKREPFVSDRKPYIPHPYEHPYADCTSCYGSGLARSLFSPVEHACSACERRYADDVRTYGAARADARRRILAIEKQLCNSLPRELKAHTVGRKPKPLSADGAAALEAHFLSDLNREYLACLRTFWAS